MASERNELIRVSKSTKLAASTMRSMIVMWQRDIKKMQKEIANFRRLLRKESIRGQ